MQGIARQGIFSGVNSIFNAVKQLAVKLEKAIFPDLEVRIVHVGYRFKTLRDLACVKRCFVLTEIISGGASDPDKQQDNNTWDKSHNMNLVEWGKSRSISEGSVIVVRKFFAGPGPLMLCEWRLTGMFQGLCSSEKNFPPNFYIQP